MPSAVRLPSPVIAEPGFFARLLLRLPSALRSVFARFRPTATGSRTIAATGKGNPIWLKRRMRPHRCASLSRHAKALLPEIVRGDDPAMLPASRSVSMAAISRRQCSIHSGCPRRSPAISSKLRPSPSRVALLSRKALPACHDDVHVLGVDLQPVADTPRGFRGRQGAAAAEERVIN